MDSSWKNLQIRMEAAWNMRTTPKTKRPKTGDIISSAHSLDWNKKKVRQLQQQWNLHQALIISAVPPFKVGRLLFFKQTCGECIDKICEQGGFFLAFCCKVSKMNYIR